MSYGKHTVASGNANLHASCTAASSPDDTFVPALRSLLNNKLGDGADTLVAAARELPQLVTLCGIQPEQQDVNLNDRGLRVEDAKLLAFDLSKNQAIKTMR